MQFLTPYKMQLPVEPGYVSPWTSFTVTALNDVIDTVAETRSMTIQVYHPGVIWTGAYYNVFYFHFLELSCR
jgi:hypothetical protein